MPGRASKGFLMKSLSQIALFVGSLAIAGALAGCSHASGGKSSLPMAEAPASKTGLILLKPELGYGDAEMRAAMAPYAAEVAKLADPIAETAVAMELRSPELGNFVVDRILEIASNVNGEPIDGAFTNLGGIRDSIPKGPISYKTISQVLPFENTVVIMEVTGEQLYTIASALARGKGGNPIAGFTIEAYSDWTIKEVKVNGEPVDRERVYTIATNNYLANGGGGMEFLADYRQSDTGVLLRDAVAEYVAREGKAGRKITPPTDNDRYITPENSR